MSVSYFSIKYIQLRHMKKYLTECDRGKVKNREARLRTAKSEDFDQIEQIWRLTWLNNVHFMWCLSDYLVYQGFILILINSPTLINAPYLFSLPGRVAQSVGHLTRKSGSWVRSGTDLATYFRFSFRFFKKGSCQLLAKVCAQSTG